MSFLDKPSPHTVALSEILREIHGNSPQKTHGSTSHFPWFSHLPKMAPCLGPGHLPWIAATSDLGPAPSQRCRPRCPPVSWENWENTWENTWHFTNDTNLWGKNMEMVPISYWFLLVPVRLNFVELTQLQKNPPRSSIFWLRVNPSITGKQW